MRRLTLAACLVTGLTAIAVTPASATFVIETDFSLSSKMFIDFANKDVTAFQGIVGSNITGPLIDITTTGPVDTGSGFSNIKPVKDGSLTELVFTPQDPDLFSDFNMRGQLVAKGSFTLTVQDNQGNPAQDFVFGDFKANQDFGRLGIVSDDETIQSVTITGNFKEVKQVAWSGPEVIPTGVPEPATWALMMAGFAFFGLAGYRRRRSALIMG